MKLGQYEVKRSALKKKKNTLTAALISFNIVTNIEFLIWTDVDLEVLGQSYVSETEIEKKKKRLDSSETNTSE